MFLYLPACFVLWQSVFILRSLSNLSQLLAFIQVVSLPEDDSRLAGRGGCGQVAEHAGDERLCAGAEAGARSVVGQIYNRWRSACGRANSLLFTRVKQATAAQSSPRPAKHATST